MHTCRQLCIILSIDQSHLISTSLVSTVFSPFYTDLDRFTHSDAVRDTEQNSSDYHLPSSKVIPADLKCLCMGSHTMRQTLTIFYRASLLYRLGWMWFSGLFWVLKILKRYKVTTGQYLLDWVKQTDWK